MNGAITAGAAGITVLNGAASKKGGFLGGSSAKKLLIHGADALRTNATLLLDEWKYFDNVVTRVARERLVIVQELMRRGLTYPIPNALGVLQLIWQTSGDLEPAEVTMTGLPEADADQLEFGLASMPIPMIHKEFNLDLRQLMVSRNGGMPLDTTMAEIAMRKVAEKVEEIVFAGLNIAPNLGQVYGLLTHPNRNTASVTTDWRTATGAEIVKDLIRGTTTLNGKNMFGPYLVFVPTEVFMRLSEDYKNESDKSILSRILELPGIEGIMPTNRLKGTNVLMVQLTSDVIQMIDGIQPTMVEWEDRGGFELNFMIFCILLPRIRADFAAQSGILHFA